MLNAKQILVSALVLAAAMATLAGCGQTGSLYLPAPAKPSKPAASAPQAASEISYSFYS